MLILFRSREASVDVGIGAPEASEIREGRGLRSVLSRPFVPDETDKPEISGAN